MEFGEEIFEDLELVIGGELEVLLLILLVVLVEVLVEGVSDGDENL